MSNSNYWFGFFYKKLLKPLFFSFDPESVHDLIIWIGEWLGSFAFGRWFVAKIFDYQNSVLRQNIWGVDFKNPVGLSAGFDKDARIYPIIESVGFGFIEIGTVTHGSYSGNKPPRLFRLPKSKSLVVNYGLRGIGAKAVIKKIKNNPSKITSIISVGRTNSKEAATFEASIEDYYQCLKEFVDNQVGDVYEINISCPNLFGGEPFTDPQSLRTLLQKLFTLEIKKPVFVKMPINLEWPEFKSLVDVCLEFQVQALVIGNLNKDRSDPAVLDLIPINLKGSLSGKPTEKLSNELIAQTYRYCGDQIKIIGVGGIFSAEDAYQKIRLGASLVELITGMIYEGPQLIGQINQELVTFLKRDGFKNISEAVGSLNKK
jgi:dihydroorotate dehydrogenase subfamily 2